MNEEISFEHQGVLFTAEYEVCGNDLYVYLPNGEVRQTVLNGLKPESSALVHLRFYADSQLKK